MAEAYKWVTPKSQTYYPPEHPLFDDNGDKVGGEYGTSGYNPSDPSKDGMVGAMYSLIHWRLPPVGNGYAEAAALFERTHVLDLRSTFTSGSGVLVRWRPGFAEGTTGTTTFSIATSPTGPWTTIGSVTDTAYRPPPTTTSWITYVDLFSASRSFRYVRVSGTNYIDYASAEAVTWRWSNQSSGTFTRTRTLDLGSTYLPSSRTMLAIWWKPGWGPGCSGRATISTSTSASGPWTVISAQDYKTHDNPPGTGRWIAYGSLSVPTFSFRYVKVEIPDCYNDFTKVAVLGTTATHPFSTQPPTP